MTSLTRPIIGEAPVLQGLHRIELTHGLSARGPHTDPAEDAGRMAQPQKRAEGGFVLGLWCGRSRHDLLAFNAQIFDTAPAHQAHRHAQVPFHAIEHAVAPVRGGVEPN
jgi:hypothetical protein